MDILASLRALDITSLTQQKAIFLLSRLQGYSMRAILLREQLRMELAHNGVVAPRRIDEQVTRLVELHLAKEILGKGGVRIALNKDIWDLDPTVIDSVFKSTKRFASEMRSDTKFAGILRRVRADINESKPQCTKISYCAFGILVACALGKHPQWERIGGEIVRKSAPSPTRRQLSLFET
mgnify:CR=1 FL=1